MLMVGRQLVDGRVLVPGKSAGRAFFVLDSLGIYGSLSVNLPDESVGAFL